MEVVDMLAADKALPRRNLDHPLTGEWNDHRDCHIRPDLVLIYRTNRVLNFAQGQVGVIAAVFLNAPLGIGIVSGLVLYQLVFVVNVMRAVTSQGGVE